MTDLAAFESEVQRLVGANVSRRAAERHVRVTHPDLASAVDAEKRRRESIDEKTEQREIIKLLRERGFTVRSTSQARASKIALGFPDLFVTHKTLPVAFFFESKRQVKGIISEAQQEFGDDCRRCGIRWYSGDRHEALRVSRELGVSEP